MKSQTTSAFLLWFFAFFLPVSAKSDSLPNSGNHDEQPAKRFVVSRSACPGLNTLANEGYLPSSGIGITARSAVIACFRGFGLSPEICAFIVLNGLRSADLPAASRFLLHDVDRSTWQIQHTRSLSREDIISPPFPFAPPPSTSLFQQRPWDVALDAMEKCKKGKREIIDANCFGRARAARVRDVGLPYDESAATHGAIEAARIMLALGDENGAELKYIESVFVHEKLPTHLGWRPKAYSGGINPMLDAAAETQRADIILRCTTGGRVATRWAERLRGQSLDDDEDPDEKVKGGLGSLIYNAFRLHRHLSPGYCRMYRTYRDEYTTEPIMASVAAAQDERRHRISHRNRAQSKRAAEGSVSVTILPISRAGSALYFETAAAMDGGPVAVNGILVL
ncbi:peroxidase, family 2 domain-containing protein [Hirsutella rhossiliensis]